MYKWRYFVNGIINYYIGNMKHLDNLKITLKSFFFMMKKV